MSKFIAIDLAPDGIFVVAGTARGGQARIERALSWTDADGEAPPVLGPDTARRIGEQLREKLKSAGIAGAPALVSVGRGRVILKELRYPAVPPAEEPALVKFQAMKELSDSPDEVVLDYAPLAERCYTSGERRSMAVVIRKELYAAIQQMCAAANLRLVAVDPPALRDRRRARACFRGRRRAGARFEIRGRGAPSCSDRRAASSPSPAPAM